MYPPSSATIHILHENPRLNILYYSLGDACPPQPEIILGINQQQTLKLALLADKLTLIINLDSQILSQGNSGSYLYIQSDLYLFYPFTIRLGMRNMKIPSSAGFDQQIFSSSASYWGDRRIAEHHLVECEHQSAQLVSHYPSGLERSVEKWVAKAQSPMPSI